MENTVNMQALGSGSDDAVLVQGAETQVVTVDDVISNAQSSEDAGHAADQGGASDTERAAEEKPSRETRKQEGIIAARVREATGGLEAKIRGELQADIDALKTQNNRLMDMWLQSEADKLVASGEVKSRDTALELLRLRNGTPAPEKQSASRTRGEDGRFVAADTGKQPTPEEARANELYLKAQRILARGGPDMLALYKGDPEVRNAVAQGESFEAVLARMHGNGQKADNTGRVPPSARSANGNTGAKKNILDMTKEEFRRFEEEKDRLLQRGVRIVL